MTEPLFTRLWKSGRLPTPPAVVIRLLELTRRSDVAVKELADTIAMDPCLSAKILRFVNSPLAGLSREVTSLHQAVTLVGVRGVKMMALSFSVLATDACKRCNGFNETQFALQSLGCGVAAKVLSEITNKGTAQEAFLVGLLSQIGRSALAGALPDEYSKVLTAALRIPADLPELERTVLGGTYAEVGAWLLRNWGIPEALCSAIETFRRYHETDTPPAMAEIIHVAEPAAAAVIPDGREERMEIQSFIEEAREHFGLDPERCLAAISDITAEIEGIRELLEIPQGRMHSSEQIESEVRERLVELSMAMHLENQCMAIQQEELMRRATTDALTGVGNRAAFDARLSLELERSVRSESPFALLMIDVDHFKKLNDTQGHPAGDRVLQAVAHLLDENVRKIDYVARYGGDEFAIIAPGTSHDGVNHLAERLRKTTEELRVPWDARRLKVTISIGVAVFTQATNGLDTCRVIKAADTQLYAAKCAGRNCTVVTMDNVAAACAESA